MLCHKKRLGFLFLAAATLNAETVIAAQECAPMCFESCECCAGPQIARLTARHIEPGGIGYKDGYTSLDLFCAPSLCSNLYGFMDARGHYFNNGKWAANLGLGLRYLPECANVVAGINAYGDWRQVRHDHHFFQVGVGLELLWPCWDFRANGYIPVGKTHRSFSTGCQGFADHEALTFKKWEVALWGIDAGLGYWLYKSDCYGLHATLGGYYFAGDFDQHAGGGYLRAKLELWNWVELRGQVSYDNLFKWQGQGELAVNFPFGPSVTRYQRKTCSCCTILNLEERLVEQPERFEIIVVSDKKKIAPALSLVTGDPLQIFFVNNTAVSGDGTFEHPFPTLLEAQLASSATDAIYVFPGDGTDKGMNEGIVLKDDQLLTSSFLPFSVHSIFVDCVIDPLSDIRPLISNVNGVVTLANRDTVQGFRINGGTIGIQNLAPIDSFTLFSNILNINNNTGLAYAVYLANPFTGTFIANENTISVSTASFRASGIVFNTTVTDADVQLTSNVISVASSLGAAVGLSIEGPSFTGTLQLLNNTIEVAANLDANAIFINSFQGTATLTGNEIRAASANSLAHGLLLNSGTGTFSSKNNEYLATSQTMRATAIDLESFNGTFSSLSDVIAASSNVDRALGVFGSVFTGEFNIQNSTVSGASNTNVSHGILFRTFNGDLVAKNNSVTATSNTNSNFAIESEISFNGTATFEGNSITANSLNGVGISSFINFTGAFIAKSNNIASTSNAGIFFQNITESSLLIENNTLTQPNNTTNNPMVTIVGSNMDALVINNVVTSAATTNRAFSMINNSGNSHLRLDDNILSSPAFTEDGTFENSAGTFEVESIDGAITGVEAMNNNARLTDDGNITYVLVPD